MKPSLTDAEHRVCLCTFLLMATASLYYWNAVLNTVYSVVVLRFPEFSWLPDTITAVYSSVAFLSAGWLSWSGALHVHYNLVGALILSLMCLLFPITVAYCEGSLAATLLVVTGAVAGVAEMFVQCSGYAVGVVLPRPYGGWISFGYGICGMMTFLLWMLFSQAIFKISDEGSSKPMGNALWCHFGVACFINVASAFAFWHFKNRDFVQQALRRAKAEPSPTEYEASFSDKDEHADDTRPSSSAVNIRHHSTIAVSQVKVPETFLVDEEPLNLWGIFTRSWPLQISMAFLMGMTMMAYPNIGPYGWRLTIRQNDLLTGIFQTGDFIGRYIPNLFSRVALLPKKLVIPLTWVRVVLLALFIVIKHQKEDADNVLTAYGAQCSLMACLALTHGWYASVYMFRIPQALTAPRDKTRATSMAVMLLVAAIAAGLWLAKVA